MATASSSLNPTPSKFQQVAEAYGPAMTKAMVDSDVSALKSDAPVTIVLQTSDGEDMGFTISDSSDESTLTWDEFLQVAQKDLAAQNYAKTVSECCGILGDRMILTAVRLNQQDESINEAFFVVTLSPQGLINTMEAFSDINAPGLEAKAEVEE